MMVIDKDKFLVLKLNPRLGLQDSNNFGEHRTIILRKHQETIIER